MAERLTLSQMAKRLQTTEKTFRTDVRDKGIPFIAVGKRKRFDPAVVEAYLMVTEKPAESNVRLFPVKRRKKVVTSKRFAEAG